MYFRTLNLFMSFIGTKNQQIKSSFLSLRKEQNMVLHCSSKSTFFRNISGTYTEDEIRTIKKCSYISVQLTEAVLK